MFEEGGTYFKIFVSYIHLTLSVSHKLYDCTKIVISPIVLSCPHDLQLSLEGAKSRCLVFILSTNSGHHLFINSVLTGPFKLKPS